MAQVPFNQEPIEARSLSSITTIAANPPAYPRNPTQEPLEQLVLYIVKVPGSRDVFLTPLKPPTKSRVSVEAINASLYYLHFARAEDEILLRDLERDKESQDAALHGGQAGTRLDAETLSRLNSFRRKPVGKQAEPSPPPPAPPPHREGVENFRPPTFDLFPSRPVCQSQADDYREGGENAHVEGPTFQQVSSRPTPSATMDPNADPNKFKIQRRPLMSSSQLNDSSVTSPVGEAQYQTRWSADLGYSRTRPPIGRLDSEPRFRSSSNAERPSREHVSPATKPGQRKIPSPTRASQSSKQASAFHITLIRRDPTHGSQWNVGSISASDGDKGTIDVEISTPGYGRFIQNDESLSLASLGLSLPSTSRDGLSSSIATATASISASKAENPLSVTIPRKFHRKILAVNHHHSHRSDDSTHAVDPSSSGIADALPAKLTPSKIRSGYYTFASPWNGTCSFVASVNGRSLKCKHTIPGPSTGAGTDTGQNPAVTVAEIRFNVPFPLGHPHNQHPSRSPFPNSLKDRTKHGSLAQIITNIQRAHHARTGSRSSPNTPSSSSSYHMRTHSDSSSEQEDRTPSAGAGVDANEDRLDLSLAREHAGGGLRGKDAKLGKLIVEDEGIKMLDLVVAACMGVWWRSSYQH